MFNRKKKNNKGFTLVELLVVIAIIGILAVVAVPSLFKNINKAHASDAVGYISAYRTAAISEQASGTEGLDTTKIEGLVEGKPSKAITGTIILDTEGTTVKDYMTATFTMTKVEIATYVREQLGADMVQSGNDANVTVKLSKIDKTN